MWAPRAPKGTLVGYNSYTIYQVHIKEQNKAIRVKDLQIFKDYKSKSASNLPDYYANGMPMLQRFILDDNNDNKKESLQADEGQKVNSKWPRDSRKVKTEKTQQTSSNRGKGRKVGIAEHIPSTSTKSRSSRTVKLSAKAQEAKTLAQQNYLSHTEQSSDIEKL